jgi:hypothetical protein
MTLHNGGLLLRVDNLRNFWGWYIDSPNK